MSAMGPSVLATYLSSLGTLLCRYLPPFGPALSQQQPHLSNSNPACPFRLILILVPFMVPSNFSTNKGKAHPSCSPYRQPQNGTRESKVPRNSPPTAHWAKVLCWLRVFKASMLESSSTNDSDGNDQAAWALHTGSIDVNQVRWWGSL